MQRRDFLRYSGVVGAASVLGLKETAAQAQNATPAPESAATLAVGISGAPVVGYTTDESTTITWAVRGASSGWVEYGETPALGRKATGAVAGLQPYDSLVLQIPIRGLKPATRYYYRVHTCAINFKNAYNIVRGETTVSEIGSFKTLDPNGQSASFVIWNDTHDNRETITELHRQTAQIAPDFLFINGDISNDISSEEKAVSLFVNPYDVPFAQNYPRFLNRGNHDVRGKAARELSRFVAVPNEFYYSFRQGPLAVLVMDTGEDKPDTHPVLAGMTDFEAFRTEQQVWLEREIQKPHIRKAPFRVLFCHIPLWWKDDDKGSQCLDARQKWHALLVRAKIQMVVSGHTHSPFHLPPTKEHPYHQLIGGGPRIDAATIITGKAAPKTFNVMMKDLKGKELANINITA